MAKIFTPGATTQSIVEWVRGNVATANAWTETRQSPHGYDDSRANRTTQRERPDAPLTRPASLCTMPRRHPSTDRASAVFCVPVRSAAPTSDSTTRLTAVTRSGLLAVHIGRPWCAVGSADCTPAPAPVARGCRLVRLRAVSRLSRLAAGGTAERNGTVRWTCTSTRGATCSPGTGCRCWAAGSPRPRRRPARSPSGIGGRVVVKAQVKVGGRGKAGGVKLAEGADEAAARATDILGMDIKGHTVHKVMVTTHGRHRRGVLLLLPARPGQPHVPVHRQRRRRHGDRAGRRTRRRKRWPRSRSTRSRAWTRRKAREIVAQAGFPADVADQVVDIAVKLWQAFVAEDATLVEVNPLAKVADGKVLVPRRQGDPRRERGLPPPGPRGVRGQGRGRPAGAARPRRRTSTTSSSTARSASSATAPAW